MSQHPELKRYVPRFIIIIIIIISSLKHTQAKQLMFIQQSSEMRGFVH
jgi:hypothetical protein